MEIKIIIKIVIFTQKLVIVLNSNDIVVAQGNAINANGVDVTVTEEVGYTPVNSG